MRVDVKFFDSIICVNIPDLPGHAINKVSRSSLLQGHYVDRAESPISGDPVARLRLVT